MIIKKKGGFVIPISLLLHSRNFSYLLFRQLSFVRSSVPKWTPQLRCSIGPLLPPSRPCCKPAKDLVVHSLGLFSSSLLSIIIFVMMSQPGSAEKTIRKIDIAQVSIPPPLVPIGLCMREVSERNREENPSPLPPPPKMMMMLLLLLHMSTQAPNEYTSSIADTCQGHTGNKFRANQRIYLSRCL